MTDKPTFDRPHLGTIVGAVRLLRALAEEKLAALPIDPLEYLSDLFCLDQVANMLGQAGIGSLTRPDTRLADAALFPEMMAMIVAIGKDREAAFARMQINADGACIALPHARVQRHPPTSERT